MSNLIRALVWNEFVHEQNNDKVKKVYPHGLHTVIADHLNRQPGLIAATATLHQPEHGLTDAALSATDVLLWWGHAAHDQVADDVVARVHTRVLEGMGLICLHSAHYSKIFKRLMGTHCSLKWREAGEKERLWNLEPGHPITQGIGDYFELPHTEMYGERFDIPTPDQLLFVSWFPGGEVFRSGCTWRRGHGRIFYFRPGHESYPIYYDPNILRVLTNAVRWSAPRILKPDSCPQSPPLEPLNIQNA